MLAELAAGSTPPGLCDRASACLNSSGAAFPRTLVDSRRRRAIGDFVADISKAKSLLGYEPQISLERGIPELLSWVREQAAKDKVESATAELESRQLVR